MPPPDADAFDDCFEDGAERDDDDDIFDPEAEEWLQRAEGAAETVVDFEND